MKTNKRSQKAERAGARMTQPTFWRRGILVPLCLSFVIGLVACHRQRADTTADWVDVDKAVGQGQVVVINHSDRVIVRLWFTPSSVHGLWPGAQPEGFAPIGPGETFTHTVPTGWWDVWFEDEDGADAMLYHAWFGGGGSTTFTVEEAWWAQGDWIEEAPQEAASELLKRGWHPAGSRNLATDPAAAETIESTPPK